MSVRFEIFSADLDAVLDFYTRVLAFTVTRDERRAPLGYLALSRDEVHLGVAFRAEPIDPAARRPPTGVEIVLEVDDLHAEYGRVLDSGWTVEEPIRERPWGLMDFRTLDAAGHYLRITSRRSESALKGHAASVGGDQQT